MKKLLLVVCLTLGVLFSYAQNSNAGATSSDQSKSSTKLKFNPTPSSKYLAGFTIGYLSEQYVSRYSDYYDSYYGSRNYGRKYKFPVTSADDGIRYTPALQLGFEILPEFKYGIGIRTGVLFDLGLYHSSRYKYTTGFFGLNVPLQISYRYEIIKDLSVFFRTGPTFNFLIVNFYRSGSHSGSAVYDTNYFDCLWAIAGGVRWKMLQLSIGGEFGLNSHGGYYKLNKPIMVSFSILFGKRPKDK